MQQSLKYLLGRELDFLARIWRQWQRRSSRTPSGRAGAARRRQGSSEVRRPPLASRRRRPAGRFPRRLSTSALAVSLFVHLAIIVLFQSPRSGATSSEETRETVVSIRLLPRAPPPAPAELDPAPPSPSQPPVCELDEVPAPRPEALPPQPEPEPVTTPAPPEEELAASSASPARPLAPPSILGLGAEPPPLPTAGPGGGLDSRRVHGKVEALARHGGSGRTENAVERGLRWLQDHQDSGGGWDPAGFGRHCRHFSPCRGPGFQEFEIGVTSLAVLAFLGAGHGPRGDGPYTRQVHRGLEHILSSQESSGALGARGSNYMYNHALATLALSEAFALTGERAYREGVGAALRFSAAAQQSGGGWDYTSEKTGRNDLSITGWQIMALYSCEQAGIAVPERMRSGARAFLDRAFTAGGQGNYADRGQEAGRRGINMTAVALLSHLYLGGASSDPRARAATRLLLGTPPERDALRRWETSFQSYYHWYTATLALFHQGGNGWQAWNHFLQKTLLPLQDDRPHSDGSWDPEASWIGHSGGRVYATAINVLTLEVYYRYERLFSPRLERGGSSRDARRP
jgi:hypothetical protein